MRVYTAIQPHKHGLHLGNYIGALMQLKQLPSEITYLGIADLHALNKTSQPQHAMDLAKSLLCLVASFDRMPIVYQQSRVPEHTQLYWILGTQTSVGGMYRMAQYNEKKMKQNTVSILTYPLLQTADILLFDATHVPVGSDQKQHLEMARQVARHFNTIYQTSLFVVPEGVYPTHPKIMSLRNPLRKMSKSDEDTLGTIFLNDSLDEIAKKVGKAVTDSEPFSTTHVSNTSRPGLCNLLSIYNVLAEEPLSPLIESKREFKDVLVQVIDRHVSRFREAYAHMDDAYVVMQLRKGAEEAQKQANQKLHQVMRAVGLE